MRSLASQAGVLLLSGVEILLDGSQYAEVRMVTNDDFDEVVNEPGRLVIVDIETEQKTVQRGSKSELDTAMQDLPSKVLIAKVLPERNIALMDRLQIHNIPMLRIYREGVLLEEFTGEVDRDRFISTVNHHLSNPDSKPHQSSHIRPLSENWLPEGVQKKSKDAPSSPFELNSK